MAKTATKFVFPKGIRHENMHLNSPWQFQRTPQMVERDENEMKETTFNRLGPVRCRFLFSILKKSQTRSQRKSFHFSVVSFQTYHNSNRFK